MEGGLYSHLASTFEMVESIASRIQITNLLTNMFRMIEEKYPEDLLPCVYLCSNRLGDEYEAAELGIGGSTISNVLTELSGLKPSLKTKPLNLFFIEFNSFIFFLKNKKKFPKFEKNV